MKICHLVPGSGGTFYCQNCLRDYSLVHALREAGHDVVMLPMYLPAFGDGADVKQNTTVFFGGISAYLRQHVPFYQYAPAWFDKLFDARWMLKLAASREGSTNAADLGPMTLSMLEGREGFQKKEFETLLEWLAGHERPDILHISNALLLAVATEAKDSLGIPVVCSLQDEEPWVEAMGEPYAQLCWEAMARHAANVDMFTPTSRWYADKMCSRLGVPSDRIKVIYPGVQVDDAEPGGIPFDPPTIGFLSRMNESLGFGTLVDAFIRLKREPELRGLRLRATGGCTSADEPFVETLLARLREHGFEGAVDLLPDFQRPERNEFLRSISVLSTPVPEGEAFGVQLIEAMAFGVPVVQPRVGAYPEIVERTGGGILYEHGDPDGLANALRSLLGDPARARALGRQGRASVMERFRIEHMAENMVRVYTHVLESVGP